MGHVNPLLLDEFLELINAPLLCNGRNPEDLVFGYEKKTGRVCLYLDQALITYVDKEIWAKYSIA